jgi:hypothetical protein
LDEHLQGAFKYPLAGTRYVDDYNLYFSNRSEAERALAMLHGIAREYELEISDLKTEILDTPEVLEPYWKTQLRGIELRAADNATSLKAMFDRAYELAKEFPQDSVLTYVTKKLNGITIPDEHWGLCESLLLRSALSEPSLLPWLLPIYERQGAEGSRPLQKTIETLCQYHSPLKQGSEIAWSLWIARSLKLRLSKDASQAVAGVDDDIVALLALDMMQHGLLPKVATPIWTAHMNAASLYSDHWLLAYEAYEQQWIRPRGTDYIKSDPYGLFSLLQRQDVKFYDPDKKWEGGILGYGDDPDLDFVEEDVEDKDDELDANVNADEFPF